MDNINLQVGMYVRTKEGFIYKFSGGVYHSIMKHIGEQNYKEKIVSKASFNLIDLLEKGDYVNGVKIDEIVHDGNYDLHFISGSGGHYRYNIENIKSIVTKEQFESVCYKVEG